MRRNAFRPSCATLLLTAQRLRMVSNLPWSEIEGNEWTVPPERNKSGLDHLVPLTDAVVELLGERRKGFVFSSDGGKTPFSGFSKSKAALDRKLAEIRKAAGRKPMPRFTFHDLRRTARSSDEPCRRVVRSCRTRAWACDPRRARCLRSARVCRRKTRRAWKSWMCRSSASCTRTRVSCGSRKVATNAKVKSPAALPRHRAECGWPYHVKAEAQTAR